MTNGLAVLDAMVLDAVYARMIKRRVFKGDLAPDGLRWAVLRRLLQTDFDKLNIAEIEGEIDMLYTYLGMHDDDTVRQYLRRLQSIEAKRLAKEMHEHLGYVPGELTAALDGIRARLQSTEAARLTKEHWWAHLISRLRRHR